MAHVSFPEYPEPCAAASASPAITASGWQLRADVASGEPNSYERYTEPSLERLRLERELDLAESRFIRVEE